MRLTAALVAVALAGPSPAWAFGALAIDTLQGPSYGFAIEQPSEAAARATAIAKCGSGCRSVVLFRGTCAAYAGDQNAGSTVFGWGYAGTQQGAQTFAMNYCRQYGGTKCQVRVWACEAPRNGAAMARADEGGSTAVATAPSPPPPPSPPPVIAPPAPPPVVANVPAIVPNVLPQVSNAGVRRIALVIGNDHYENLEPLQKAVNDARAVSNALTSIGFDVIRVENGVRRLMNQKMVEFTGRVGRGDTAFFFYSGHGVEIHGQNFLLPVDMPRVGENQEAMVTAEGIPADGIIEQLQNRGAKVTMMVLDACRENPFAKQGTRGIGATRGLAQTIAPEGVFVLYSAGVGQTALDRLSNADSDPNSVFTRKFIQVLTAPGLSVQEMAKRTQASVRELAGSVNHPQMPAYYDQILGQYSLVPTR